MQNRHTNRAKYFSEQEITTRNHVIPFLAPHIRLQPGISVLEVGCGEGGNLKPFLELGAKVTGVDLSEKKIANALTYLAGFRESERLRLLSKDIYNAGTDLSGPYDLIIMRDVIEHIHDQLKFMKFIRNFLGPEGIFFLAFPPWYNPFGGHQQVCASKILSHLPYFHLLPGGLYRFGLKIFGEPQERIDGLMEVRQTGISIERFRKIARDAGYETVAESLYIINPNYQVKFGMKPRKLPGIFSLPFLRNFITTADYVILRKI